jgi:hypothetical protein
VRQLIVGVAEESAGIQGNLRKIAAREFRRGAALGGQQAAQRDNFMPSGLDALQQIGN